MMKPSKRTPPPPEAVAIIRFTHTTPADAQPTYLNTVQQWAYRFQDGSYHRVDFLTGYCEKYPLDDPQAEGWRVSDEETLV
jgi:hypothetical protein